MSRIAITLIVPAILLATSAKATSVQEACHPHLIGATDMHGRLVREQSEIGDARDAEAAWAKAATEAELTDRYGAPTDSDNDGIVGWQGPRTDNLNFGEIYRHKGSGPNSDVWQREDGAWCLYFSRGGMRIIVDQKLGAPQTRVVRFVVG